MWLPGTWSHDFILLSRLLAEAAVDTVFQMPLRIPLLLLPATVMGGMVTIAALKEEWADVPLTTTVGVCSLAEEAALVTRIMAMEEAEVMEAELSISLAMARFRAQDKYWRTGRMAQIRQQILLPLVMLEAVMELVVAVAVVPCALIHPGSFQQLPFLRKVVTVVTSKCTRRC
jgi:hypothetical protein